MVFNSSIFLVFIVVFFLLYWLINNKMGKKARNLFTIIGSYVFYGWWDWRFLGLIIVSSVIDFYVGKAISRSDSKGFRKLLLITSLLSNLGILAFFKYYDFFVDSLNDMLQLFSVSAGFTTLNIILPVGISFYTFQTLSYTIDIYRKKISYTDDILSFFAFVSFFPQLVAGPIERASNLLWQFETSKKFDYNRSVVGMRYILWGMFAKLVIADNFGILANACFDTGNAATGLTTLAGAFFFAFQIYADFSGYSSVAIGVAKLLGFDLMKNFNTPYFAVSLTDFWHRWHISLSTWFRDNLYIPLGGNRKSALRSDFNILVTFLVSGLWHGAKVTFLVWGVLHGLLIVLEKKIKLKLLRIPAAVLVFVLVSLLWIPFRAENIGHLADLTNSLFLFSEYSLLPLLDVITDFSEVRFLVLFGILCLFLITEYNFKNTDFNEWINSKSKVFRFSIYYLLILIILFVSNFSVKPDFIYFQF